MTKITFDAKDYQSDKDWKEFIKALYKTMVSEYEAVEKNNKKKVFQGEIRFDLTVENGDILGMDAPQLSEIFEDNIDRMQAQKVLGMVSILHVTIPQFSVSVIKQLFRRAEECFLSGTKTIRGMPEGNCSLIVGRTLKLPENCDNWPKFIRTICKELSTYPDNERIFFRLSFKNALIFSEDPPAETDYRDYLDTEKQCEPTKTTKILSRINLIQTDTKNFSTLSLTKVFPWTQNLLLPDTESISEVLTETSFGIRSSEDFPAITEMCKKPCSRLRSVFAPKVTAISNAAFFNFNIWKILTRRS